MKVKNYKELDVWKKGIEMTDKIYNITKNFPKHGKYGLTNQLQRCVVSIPSNIAEGFMRNHSKEYIQFLYVALGSCAELETQLIISRGRNYIAQKDLEDLEEDINHESRMLMNLIKSLKIIGGYESRITNHEKTR